MNKYIIQLKYDTDVDKSVRYDRNLTQQLSQQQVIANITTRFDTEDLTNDEREYIKTNILNILKLYTEEDEIFENTIFLKLIKLNDFNKDILDPIVLYTQSSIYPVVFEDYLNNFIHIVLSDSTNIVITEFGTTYISSINLAESIIDVISELTVEQLNESITSDDTSTQTYTVLDGETTIETGNILSTYTLRVTAENNENIKSYSFNFS